MPKKILIAEDEQSYRSALKKKLMSVGYEVSTVNDGKAVLSELKRFKPDLLLLDLVMPEMSGYDVLETVRIKDNNQVPVIILSNIDSAADVEQAKRFGIKKFISKGDTSLKDILLTLAETLA